MAHLKTGKGVNLLVTSLDRRWYEDQRGDRGQVHDLEVEVDHRDPQGHAQTNPRLLETRPTANGRMFSPVSTYTRDDAGAIPHAAGEHGFFELCDSDGQRVGTMYAVKADIRAVTPEMIPGADHRDLRLDPQTLRSSDFDVGPGTRQAQYESMLRARSSEFAPQDLDGTGTHGLSDGDERRLYETTLTPDERINGVEPVRLQAVRFERGVSSQAGLAAARPPVRSVPSTPRPGEPGSRFNPIVRERGPTRMDDPPITGDRQTDPPMSQVPDTEKPARTRKLRMPTAEEVSAGGRIARQGAAGAAAGAKVSSAIPHPAGKVIGVVGGAVVGSAKGLVGEADQRVEARRKEAEKDSDGAVESDSVDQAATADVPVENTSKRHSSGPQVSDWLPEPMRTDDAERVRSQDGRPVSQTYDYRFEDTSQPSPGPEMDR